MTPEIAQWVGFGLLAYAVTAIVLLWALWLFYLATMSLWTVELAGKQTRFAANCAKPIMWIGAVLGFLVNTFVMTVVLLELPREMAVSPRLARHLHKPSPDYRTRFAQWFAANLLDAYDPRGVHI
jgi:hypothetical protein